MAQLVEHHLAKVGVAGSNPVVRSRMLEGRSFQAGLFPSKCSRAEVLKPQPASTTSGAALWLCGEPDGAEGSSPDELSGLRAVCERAEVLKPQPASTKPEGRRGQVVRQRPAKPSPPVRIRASPPISLQLSPRKFMLAGFCFLFISHRD